MAVMDAFTFHGFVPDVMPDDEAGQAVGRCVLCGKPKHMFVQVGTGLWGCKKCGADGNVYGFLEHLHGKYLNGTSPEDYDRLAHLRSGSARPEDYRRHGLAWTGSNWLLPVYGLSGKIANLRTWRESGKELNTKSSPWVNTKGLSSILWGSDRLNSHAGGGRRVWICEGEWDGIAMDSLLIRTKRANKEMAIAVPGAFVMKREWLSLLAERNVVLAYDADPTGDSAMLDKGKMLRGAVNSVKYLRWPLDAPKGYDVSDVVAEGKSPMKKLLSMVSSAPRTESLLKEKQPSLHNGAPAKTTAKPLRASVGNGNFSSGGKFEEVLRAYKIWLDMSPDSVKALRIVLSVILSNQVAGDPLWIYLVAPPGGGKTALLNPLRSIDDYCIFRSNLTMHSLVSGWQGATDPSLLPKLDGKTLVLKDMTEILSAPQHVQEEVFGTLRGAYDGTLERSYGNQVVRKYESKFSIVAGVTMQIYGHHQANMGERMLKFQLSRTREEHESIIERAMDNLGKESAMDEALAAATASFLGRKVYVDKLVERIPAWVRRRIIALSQLVARLRMEVDRDFRGDQVKFRPQVEVGTRLAKQLLKLGMLLTETNDDGHKFGPEEWSIVERVAFDTSIGWNLDVIQSMMAVGNGRMTKGELVAASNLPSSNVTRRLEDLSIMGSIRKTFDQETKNSVYEVVAAVQDLWRRAMVQEDHSALVAQIRRARHCKIRPRRVNGR